MELTNLNKNKATRRAKIPISEMIYGKVPPQAIDLEKAILGAIMIDKSAIDLVSEWLKPESFYTDSHQKIFRAAGVLAGRSQPIDCGTVCEQLQSTGHLEDSGGRQYVWGLTNNVVSSAHIETHAQIILGKYIKREMIRVGGEMVQDGFEDTTDVFELLEHVDQAVLSIANSVHTKQYDRLDTLIVQKVKELEAIRHSPEKLSGVPSGYRDIDQLTHGWQKTDLITVAARPSMGKTAFALQLARNAVMNVEKPTPTAFFSLEMSSGQLVNRLFAAEAEIALEKISRGRMEDDDMRNLYENAIKKLGSIPLFIDDTPNLNIFQLRSKCRKLKKKEEIGLIVIDYIQLMSGTSNNGRQNREQEISEISRGLKGLAKELGVPIIALSQLSRAVETRGGEKMPQLSDLRESGAIEQDSDVVIFLYRPEYYSVMRDDKGESSPGETHIKFAKHRNGKLDVVKLKAMLWCQKFVSVEKKAPSEFKKGKGEPKLSGPMIPGEIQQENLPF